MLPARWHRRPLDDAFGSAPLYRGAALPSTPQSEPDLERRFGGVGRLYGAAALQRLGRARVAVIGIGGVGSWAAEALARCAVGRIVLIDLDHIAESNANRQIHALGDEFGKSKAIAMADRIRAINPSAEVDAVEEFVAPDNLADLVTGFDVVLDCIDQVLPKAALIAWCRQTGQPVIVTGAAGGRTDPTRIRHTDLAAVRGDPLLSGVRRRLRRDHGFPVAAPGSAAQLRARFGVSAVFCDEVAGATVSPDAVLRHPGAGLSCTGYGSSVVVTAPLGFAAAALALASLLGS